jgi:hypothetical protein
VGSGEHASENTGFINDREMFDKLSDCQLLDKDSMHGDNYKDTKAVQLISVLASHPGGFPVKISLEKFRPTNPKLRILCFAQPRKKSGKELKQEKITAALLFLIRLYTTASQIR